MKTALLFMLLLCGGISSFSQSHWITKRVGQNLSVKFPKEPNTDTKPDKRLSLYVVKSESSGCMFTVIVRNKVMPDYERISNLSLAEKNEKINAFLDKGIMQFIQDSKVVSPLSDIKIGEYNGKEITYSQVNGSLGKTTTQFTKFVFANNDLYIVQCSVDKVENSENEKNVFLNSLSIN